jgi:hypothetical protein
MEEGFASVNPMRSAGLKGGNNLSEGDGLELTERRVSNFTGVNPMRKSNKEVFPK